MTKKNILIGYSLFVFLAVIVFEAIAKRLDPGWGNHPINRDFGMYIAVILYLAYVLYSWKSNWSEFRKRFFISIPFIMLFSIFIKVLGYDVYGCILSGMLFSVPLLLKTPNWKKHFAVILIASCSLSLINKLSFGFLDEAQADSFVTQGFIFLAFALTLSFLLLYLAKIIKEEKAPELRPIFVRSFKFSITLSLFATVYFVLNLHDQLKLPFPIQLLVNIILVIMFIGIAYKFNLLLVERKKRPKNRIEEIRNELHEFYLKEREKVKK